jgi:lysophospholipase L1-like esterase
VIGDARSRFGSIVYRVAEQLLDPAQIERYRAANAALLAEGDPRPRVVFIGDSLIEGWRRLESLGPAGIRFVNRGVSGQTSGQILLRFEDDAMALSPAAVVILAGSNDVRALFGPAAGVGAAARRRVARHVTAMTRIARACGSRVAIGALPPIRLGHAGARSSAGRRDPAVIRAVNEWLRGFAAAQTAPLIDFHAALVDDEGALDRRFTDDGLHPNEAGQERMASALQLVQDQLW